MTARDATATITLLAKEPHLTLEGLVTEATRHTDSPADLAVLQGVHQRPQHSQPPAHISEMQRLQMLNEIGRCLSARLDMRNVYDTVYEQLSRVMDTSMFFLAMKDEDLDKAHLPYVREFGRVSLDLTTPSGRSVTTHVFELGQPLLFHTAEQYERYAVGHGLPVIVLGDESQGCAESMLYAPLNTENGTIGTLSAQSTRQYAYSKDDLDTLTVIAAQAAIAIQNARLYEASLEAARRIQALLRVAETVNSSLELTSVLDAILTGIRDVLPFKLAAILLPNFKESVLQTAGALGEVAETDRRQLTVPLGQGVTGKVFESGEALVISDVRHGAGHIPELEGIGSEVAVPLKRGKVVSGVLTVDRSERNAFRDEDVELLTLFASQAATAIENARLFEEQRSRVLEMETIQGIVQEMAIVHHNDAIASTVERGLRRLVDFDECIIFLLDESGAYVEPILASATPRVEMKVPRRARKLGEGVSGWVALHAKSAIFDSTRLDPRVSQDIRTADFDMSVIGVPLMHHDKVSGVITVGKEGPGRFDESDLRALEIIGAHASIGFDRCRLYSELHRQATTDELTGLFNRRWFMERLNAEKSRALRNYHPLTALMLDVDDFKGVNDTYGHVAGDAVLKALAQLIRTELRTEDIVARYGGEEFLVLLPEVTVDGAVAVADRLSHMVATTELAPEAGVRHISVSVGIADLWPEDAADEIVSRADQAMYEAKRGGGNALCIRHPDRYEHILSGSVYPMREDAA